MHVVEQDSVATLETRFRTERRAPLARRIWIVWQARLGRTAVEIALQAAVSRRTVQNWVRRYNERGLPGLEDQPGRGRKPPLSPEQQRQFCQRLERGPTVEEGVCTFRGRDLQRILEQEFGQRKSLSAVYLLLHQLGYSSLLPRPRHRQSDPEAQAEFKKNSRPRWSESSRPIPRSD